MTIYLYVKTHNKTGLKYLGKTTKIDPHKYTGSGKRWLAHLNKHGYDYSTEILLATESPDELKETGIFFSNLWNIVESKDWANFMPEKGDGVDSASAKRENKRKTDAGIHHWQGDGSSQRKLQKRLVEEGKHHFLGGELQRKINKQKVVDGTHIFLNMDRSHVAKNNIKMVLEGTHHFLGSNLNKKMIAEGKHTSTRPESIEKIKKKARERVENGQHELLNTTACIDENGKIVRVSLEIYKSEENKKTKRYVHVNSKEGKRRRNYSSSETII
jgi:hypothetical protein